MLCAFSYFFFLAFFPVLFDVSYSKLGSLDLPQGLYLITPDLTDTARLLSLTAAALEVGVRWLQYRNKAATTNLRLEQAQALRALTRRYGARLIVNDDVVLAARVQAEGVHLGREDGDAVPARARLGSDAVIGVSAYDDLARARRAAQAGASYVAFGALFDSRVKPQAPRAPLALLGQARQEGLHVVGIGGIDASNMVQVAAAGAHAAALISAVYDAADSGSAAQRLISTFALHAKEYE